jgi:hypothetical protein
MRRQWLGKKAQAESINNTDFNMPSWIVLDNACDNDKDNGKVKGKDTKEDDENNGMQTTAASSATTGSDTRPHHHLRRHHIRKHAYQHQTHMHNSDTGTTAVVVPQILLPATAAAAAKRQQQQPDSVDDTTATTTSSTSTSTTTRSSIRSTRSGSCPFSPSHSLAYLCPSNPLDVPTSWLDQVPSQSLSFGGGGGDGGGVNGGGVNVLRVLNQDDGAGFFALLIDVVNQLTWADHFGLVPAVVSE